MSEQALCRSSPVTGQEENCLPDRVGHRYLKPHKMVHSGGLLCIVVKINSNCMKQNRRFLVILKGELKKKEQVLRRLHAA